MNVTAAATAAFFRPVLPFAFLCIPLYHPKTNVVEAHSIALTVHYALVNLKNLAFSN